MSGPKGARGRRFEGALDPDGIMNPGKMGLARRGGFAGSSVPGPR